MGRKLFSFAPPIVQHGGRANNESRFRIGRILVAQPGEPGQRLQRFSKAHVIGQDAAEARARKMAEEVKSFLLVWAQIRLDGRRQIDRWDAFKIRQLLLERLQLRAVSEALQLIVIEMRGLVEAD